MGVLFDYFAAPSDDAAAVTIDRVGGPGSQAVASESPKRGMFGRKRAAEPELSTDPSLPVYETLSVKGIDPIVQLGTLEELLTGRPYDDVVEDPRSGKDLAVRDGGERVVVTLTESLVAALAGASDERLGEVALPWSETEEFWGRGDPEELAHFLHGISALARHAQESGDRLYCWICV